MNYWKIGTRSGWTTGAKANTFAEACEKCGLDWRNCYLIAVY